MKEKVNIKKRITKPMTASLLRIKRLKTIMPGESTLIRRESSNFISGRWLPDFANSKWSSIFSTSLSIGMDSCNPSGFEAEAVGLVWAIKPLSFSEESLLSSVISHLLIHSYAWVNHSVHNIRDDQTDLRKHS